MFGSPSLHPRLARLAFLLALAVRSATTGAEWQGDLRRVKLPAGNRQSRPADAVGEYDTFVPVFSVDIPHKERPRGFFDLERQRLSASSRISPSAPSSRGAASADVGVTAFGSSAGASPSPADAAASGPAFGEETAAALIRLKEERKERERGERKRHTREADPVVAQRHSGRASGGRRGRPGRRLQAGGGGSSAQPGPQCSGQCCSSRAPAIPPGMPQTTSSWLTASLAHGARVQVRSKVWGTWWQLPSGDWGDTSATLAGNNATQPDASQVLTVVRLSNSTLQLQTPGGTFLCQGADQQVHLCSNASSPATVWAVEPGYTVYAGAVPVSFLFFRNVASGLYVTEDGNKGPLLYSSNAQEWELHSVHEVMQVPAVRGTNLGGWLWYEFWMNPTVSFRNFIDGTKFTLFSPAVNAFVNAPGGGGTILSANLSPAAAASSLTHQFFLATVPGAAGGTRMVSTQLLQYWTLQPASTTVSVASTSPGPAPTSQFVFILRTLNASSPPVFVSSPVLIQAPNGMFLQANPDGSVTADYAGSLSNAAIWQSRAVFNLTVVSTTANMFQAALSLGAQASPFFQSLWSSFITESDWQQMKALSINAVRIPIPYWIAADPSPPFPWPALASSFLDWAFAMGAKYSIRIWFSMHMVAGGQAGPGNSPDGLVRANFSATLPTVRWLVARYGANPMWLGMGFMNEPVAPGVVGMAGVDAGDMQGYYAAAHDIVRLACPCCFVSMESRIGASYYDLFWFLLDPWHPNVWYESHVYNCFASGMSAATADAEIANEWTQVPESIAFMQRNGRPMLVGEFCNAMGSAPVTAAQQANFSLAQMQAVARAQAGWFFWSWKLSNAGILHWQFPLSAAKGWLPKKPDGNWY